MPGDATPPVVLVVDDDDAVRNALNSLLRSVGYDVRLFASAQDLMQTPAALDGNCLILDIRLPMVGGLDFQSRLVEEGILVPIIFMTAHGDIPMSVKAMKAGAVDFLAKPFRDQEILDAVAAAVESDIKRRQSDEALTRLQMRYDTLSTREKEIMDFATSGLMNKQIAGELELSEITVKVHRGKLMKKMEARTLSDLVKMSEALKNSNLKKSD